MQHEYFMSEALKEAQLALKHGDVPVGAVIVEEHKIIARAHNQIELLKDPTAHAEMIAITQACAHNQSERLTKAILYVTLEPCPMCAGALVLARIKEIFYGAADPKAGACGSLYDIVNDVRLNHRIKVIHGLMKDECQGLLQEFFKKLRADKR